MRNIAIRIGLFALIGVGALIARPFLTGGANDLKVGECFDVPAIGQTVEEVQHHPCTDGHSAEVVFVGEFTAAKGVPYPALEILDQDVESLCVPAFDSYTGLAFETDPDWTMGYFYPVSEDWDKGDRDLVCYATRIDEAVTSTSIKQT